MQRSIFIYFLGFSQTGFSINQTQIPFGQKASPLDSSAIEWKDFPDQRDFITKKHLFVFVYTDWCVHCKRMMTETLSNREIAELISNNFYPVKLNAETTETIVFNNHIYTNMGKAGSQSKHPLAIKLAAMNGTIGFPTMVFLGPDLEPVLTPLRGYKSAEYMIDYLKYIDSGCYPEVSFEDYLGNQ